MLDAPGEDHEILAELYTDCGYELPHTCDCELRARTLARLSPQNFDFGILIGRADDLVVSDRSRGCGSCVVGSGVGVSTSAATIA